MKIGGMVASRLTHLFTIRKDARVGVLAGRLEDTLNPRKVQRGNLRVGHDQNVVALGVRGKCFRVGVQQIGPYVNWIISTLGQRHRHYLGLRPERSRGGRTVRHQVRVRGVQQQRKLQQEEAEHGKMHHRKEGFCESTTD